MKFVENDFDKTYNKLSTLNDTFVVPEEYREFAGLDTARYIKQIEDYVNQRGSKYRVRDGATHTHHIWPTSLNGPDIDANKVDLTFHEHKRVHGILADDNPDCYEAQQAYLRLLLAAKDGESAKERVRIAKRVARLLSTARAGEGNPNFNNNWTDDQKAAHKDIMQNSNNNIKVAIKQVNKQDEEEAETPAIKTIIKNSIGEAAAYLGFENGSSIKKFCNEERELPDSLSDQGIIAIYYSDKDGNKINPEKTFNEKRSIIGINYNNYNDIIETQSIADAAWKVYIKQHNINEDELSAEQRAEYKKAANSLKGGIQKACANNSDPNKLSYNMRNGYYWFYKDSFTPQIKSALSRTMSPTLNEK